ncbi:hypothetical protein RQP46_005732 [Phenoliferia psychrophenolica]
MKLDQLSGKGIFSCKECLYRFNEHTHLSTAAEIESKNFNGQHGRACLFKNAVNVGASQPEERIMTTGLHTVRDIWCVRCKITLGWKYDAAYEVNQKYKEGKFIIENALRDHTAPVWPPFAPPAANTASRSLHTLASSVRSTLGNSFTSTACPSFFQNFLADPTFIACAPFSLLLSTSSAFFTAEKSPTVLLPYVLDATCAPAADTCQATMDALATEVRLESTCGKDLALGNALAVEALMGFQNYALMRQAGCQKSNTTGQYCFAEATAQASPSEQYFYFLPTGISLPSGTITTCGGCTQNLMATFATYATNASLSISKTYAAARVAVSTTCGPTFAPVIATAVLSSAPPPYPHVPLGALLLSTAAFLATLL